MLAPGVILSAALSAAHPAPALVFADASVAYAREVRLGDVADLSDLPASLRSRAQAVVLLRFAPGTETLRIDTTRLVERARAQLPALTPFLRAEPGQIITIRLDGGRGTVPAIGTTAPACMVVVRPVPAGIAPTADDLQTAPCTTSRRRSFAYDSVSGVATATRSLSIGDVVAAISPSSLASVRTGDAYVVTARVGPVSVRRRVTAVQTARTGQAMFVAGDDGEVFAVPQPAVETDR